MTDYQPGDRVRLKCPCHKGQIAVVESGPFWLDQGQGYVKLRGLATAGMAWLTELEKIA